MTPRRSASARRRCWRLALGPVGGAGSGRRRLLDALVAEVATLQPLPAIGALERCPALRRTTRRGGPGAGCRRHRRARPPSGLRAGPCAAPVDRSLRSTRVRRLRPAGSGWRMGWPGGEVAAGVGRPGRRRVVRRARHAGRRSTARPAPAAAHDRGLPCPGRLDARSEGPSGVRRRPLVVLQARGAERAGLAGRRDTERSRATPGPRRPTSPWASSGSTRPRRWACVRWSGLGRACAPSPPTGCPSSARIRRCSGLFWLAGQGGYGIQTAPAMARCLAGLLTGGRHARRRGGTRSDGRETSRLLGSQPILRGSPTVVGSAHERGQVQRLLRAGPGRGDQAGGADEDETVSAWLAEAARQRVRNLMLGKFSPR